jgi:uncharacterized repeat protein (TIGR03803 family)
MGNLAAPKKASLLLFTLLTAFLSHGQPKLVGLLSSGGIGPGNGTLHGNGTIIQYTSGSALVGIIDSLATTANPLSITLTEGPDGKLYGVTQDSDSTPDGAIISYDCISNKYTVAAKFDNNNGIYPAGPLMLANNGLMYGLAGHGGLYGEGTLYSFNIITDSISDLVDLSYYGTDGTMTQAANGNLYGLVNGYYGSNIISYNIGSGHDTTLFSFTSSASPHGNLIESGADTLYGLTQGDGTNGGGTIFQFITASSAYRIIYDFSAPSRPQGSLMRATNGTLYGMTLQGGLYNGGVIFNFNPSTGLYTSLHDFDTIPTDGYEPIGDLYQASDGDLYGATTSGGYYGQGVLFQYNINTATYTVEINFDSTTGYLPQYGHLVELQPVSHIISIQPTNDTTCGGTMASLTAIDSSSFPAAVQWQISSDGGATYTNVAGAIDTAYTSASPLHNFRSLLRAVFSSGDTSASALLLAWPRDTFYQSLSICYGQSYSFNGHTYDAGGIYIDLLAGLGVNGCDSVVSTDISIWPPDTSMQNPIICYAQSYTSHGHTYTATGIYIDTILGAGLHGCDSMVVTGLTVLPLDTFSQDQTICYGQSYTINGNLYDTAGTYSDTLSGMSMYGCDSIVTTALIILPPDTFYQNQKICSDQNYIINGHTYTTPGVYIDTIAGLGTNGCDSIVTTHLSFWQPDTFSQNQTICAYQSYSINGHNYNLSGIYRDTLSGMGSHGCDSIVNTNLIVLPADTLLQAQTICNGQAYVYNGHTYTTPGTYTDTLPGTGMHGCDSLVTTTLSVLNNLYAYYALEPSSTPHVWYILNQCFGPGSLSYTWIWGDSSTNSNGDTPSHSYASPGYYDICVLVTDSEGCTASYCDSNTYLFKDQSGQMVQVEVVNQLPNGVDNLSSYHFSLSPNPTQGSFSIAHNYPGKLNIQVVDLPGATVRAYIMADQQEIFDIGDLAAGMYQIQISTDDRQTLTVLKLVKE